MGHVDKVCKYNIFTLGLGSSGYSDDCPVKDGKTVLL